MKFTNSLDMGGFGYLFTGENDHNVMHNSTLINLNVLKVCSEFGIEKVLYTSSELVFILNIIKWMRTIQVVLKIQFIQKPDSEYGWEKLYGERLYLSFRKIMESIRRLQDYIISLFQWEHMMVEKKKLFRLFVEKL